jgi:hypothetical protein
VKEVKWWKEVWKEGRNVKERSVEGRNVKEGNTEGSEGIL